LKVLQRYNIENKNVSPIGNNNILRKLQIFSAVRKFSFEGFKNKC